MRYICKVNMLNVKFMNTIYFAGGCFWGTEHFFQKIRGVVSTRVGYANSIVEAPSYEQVCTSATNAAECVAVEFDPQLVTLPFLIRLYFMTIDPTSLNRQGGDKGTQYRTGIYYTDPAQLPVIKATVDELAKDYTEPVVVEILPLENFYPAELYHQHYLDKNPGGYCHINPRLFAIAKEAVDPEAPVK